MGKVQPAKAAGVNLRPDNGYARDGASLSGMGSAWNREQRATLPRAFGRFVLVLLVGALIGCDGRGVVWTPCDSTLSKHEDARVARASERSASEAAELWIKFAGENASLGDASGIGQLFLEGGRLEDALQYLERRAHSDCHFDRGYHLLLVAETYFDLGREAEARSYVALTREFLRSDTVDRGESLAPPGAQVTHLVRDGLRRLEERMDELEWERYRQRTSGT